MIATPQLNSIVCIHWWDTFTQDDGWHTVDEVRSEPYNVATVGHVIHTSPSVISVAAALADERGCYHISVIPCCCIQKIEVLTPTEG